MDKYFNELKDTCKIAEDDKYMDRFLKVYKEYGLDGSLTLGVRENNYHDCYGVYKAKQVIEAKKGLMKKSILFLYIKLLTKAKKYVDT